MPSRTAPREDPRPDLDRLRALRQSPAERRSFARELLTRRHPETVLAALDALAEAPDPADRQSLRSLYSALTADYRRRDPGGMLRARVIAALARFPDSDDLPIAIDAVTARESTTNTTGELLRAAGLELLLQLDPRSAAAFAALALARGDAHPMSGEPAATAVRVLIALERTDALVIAALAEGLSLPGEVRAAAIRGLADTPPALEPVLVEALAPCRFGEPQLALADLLLASPDPPPPSRQEALVSLIASADHPSSYASLATTIVAARRDWAIELLLDHLRGEVRPAFLRAGLDALEYAPPRPGLTEARRAIQERLGRQA